MGFAFHDGPVSFLCPFLFFCKNGLQCLVAETRERATRAKKDESAAALHVFGITGENTVQRLFDIRVQNHHVALKKSEGEKNTREKKRKLKDKRQRRNKSFHALGLSDGEGRRSSVFPLLVASKILFII